MRVITSADVQFSAQNQVKTKKRSSRPQISGAPILQRVTTTGGAGLNPPAANEFLRFSHKKTLVLAHFLSKRDMQRVQSL